MRDIVELTKDLVAFHTVEGEVEQFRQAFDYCKNYLRDDGVYFTEAMHNGRPSLLIGNCPGSQFDVVILGHMDVVPASAKMFSLRQEGDRLYGRGVMDMKIYLAIALNLFKQLVNCPTRFALLMVGDEEIGGGTADHWFNDLGLQAKLLLDPDGGDQKQRIIYQCKSAVTVKLEGKGVAEHGSRPWLGYDAIEEILQTVQRLREYFPYYSPNLVPEDNWVDTMHVGIIQGGTATNQLADRAMAMLDMRLTENYDQSRLENLLQQCMSSQVEYTLVSTTFTPSFTVDNPYSQYYAGLVRKHMEVEPEFCRETGMTDAHAIAGLKHLMVITHQGTGGCIHAEGEWSELSSMRQLAEVQAEFLKNFAHIN